MKLEEQPGDSVVIASVSSIAENFSLTACNIELVAEGQILNLPSKVKDGNIKVRLTELDQKWQVCISHKIFRARSHFKADTGSHDNQR